MKKWLTIGLLLACASAVGGAAAAQDTIDQARQQTTAAQPSTEIAKGLTVHEWGTFTSFSGSDGIRMEFRPLLNSDLPDFVMDRARQSGDVLSKLNYRAFVRMETPVTYFYTDHPRTVRAKVRFPEGLLTEFYPPVEKLMPKYSRPKELGLRNTALDWGEVQLIPMSYLEKELTGELGELIQGRKLDELLPKSLHEGLVEQHYNYARETDSALVHVRRQPRPNKAAETESVIEGDFELFSPTGDFFEKFLFYRGLGNFSLPLDVQSRGAHQYTVHNNGSDDLSWFMVLDVRNHQISFATFDGVKAGAHRDVTLSPEQSGPAALEDALQTALVAEGLYEAEAKSMIKTWRSSWFDEEGTRVLYMVPQRITEEMLPLEIEPRPETTVRVLVGRLDLMTPEDEALVREMVQRSATARAVARKQAKEQEIPFVYPIPDELLKLGRFVEPALARIYAVSTDDVIRDEAARLIHDIKETVNWDAGIPFGS